MKGSYFSVRGCKKGECLVAWRGGWKIWCFLEVKGRGRNVGGDSKAFDSLKRDLSGSEYEESGSRAARDLVPLNCGKPVD